jgi:hypothetical protein
MARAAPPAPIVAQGAEETLTVGGVPDEPAVARHDRVHGAERGRGRRELVARGRGIALVGHRHAQARDVQRAHALERGRGVAGPDVERDEDPVEIEGAEGRVVDRGRT